MDIDKKHIEVITHDNKGSVIARDVIEGDYGERFTTRVKKDVVNSMNQREIIIETIDN